LFPLVYLVHIIEEVRGVGHAFNVSLNTFLILSAATWLLMIVGIVLAQRLGFPHFIAVCLGSTIFLNGLWHIFNSLMNRGFEAGVVSGTVIFIPLGVATLIDLRNSMRRQRYMVAMVLGLVIQTIAAILAA
jgi:uncharacterized protein with HXXEE motif